MVHFDDGFANRETKAEAFATSAALLECLENLFEMLRFNPNAGVADFHAQGPRLRVMSSDRDRALPRSEFRGVLQEIPKHLLQARFVGQDRVVCGIQFDREIQLPGGNFVADDIHGVIEQLVGVGFPQMQSEFSASDPGKIEQVVNQPGLELHITANHLQTFVTSGESGDRSPFRPPSGWGEGVRSTGVTKPVMAALADSAAFLSLEFFVQLAVVNEEPDLVPERFRSGRRSSSG